jgi:hypothetical protein
MVLYASSGAQAVSVGMLVNQVIAGTVSLGPTNGASVSVTVEVGLAAGKNFVTLVGGGEGVRVESIVVRTGTSGPGSGSPPSSAA